MTTAEWITLAGIITGPVVAVIISFWMEGRRRQRDQKLTILRLLISTRHLPSDPNFQIAINLIPVEFANRRKVITAYKEFLDASRVPVSPGSELSVSQNTAAKTARLIYEAAKSLGFEVHETDIQYAGYSSQGWSERDQLAMDSQRATRDIANILFLQSRIMSGQPLTVEERKWLGIQELLDS